MIRYVIYRRVSTKEQGKSGLGLEAQDRDIGLFLDTYAGALWEVVAEFTEIDSGGDDDRPVLREAVTTAKKEKAILLVAKLDRLSRRVSFISSLMEDKRLDFKVAVMPNADKFQLHIYAALAEQERDFISQRTKAALAEAKARGTSLGGLRDTTMKRNAVLREQANDRAKKLEGIVTPLRDRGESLRTIARVLNDAGIQTPRGTLWQAVQVKRLLQRIDMEPA